MAFLEVIECVYDILEAVHVVPVDVPVAEVAIAGVLGVADLLAHDVPGHVLPSRDATFQHRHLQLTEHLEQGKT